MSGKGKVLILGGTGAMGVYLVPELTDMGYEVHVVSLDELRSADPRITYIKADATDDNFLKSHLALQYEAIVDFMLNSSTEKFSARYEWMLKSAGHYIYLSTYRIYAAGIPINNPRTRYAGEASGRGMLFSKGGCTRGLIPSLTAPRGGVLNPSARITENSPRLLDVSEDREFLGTNDYSLYKARNEDTLRKSTYENWTIVRPAITYSKRRFQLVTLEADTVVYRALKGLPLALPEEALPVQGTMTWAGDVAKMIARLLLNPQAYRETFTLATAEHHSWKEVAEYYREIAGLKYIPVDTENYLRIIAGYDENRYNAAKYQLIYDRLLDRVVDNSKILRVAGMKQSDLTSLRDGLKKELDALPSDAISSNKEVNARMDTFLSGRRILK
jgi:nucleoside-diphosphate-sugar epimerase